MFTLLMEFARTPGAKDKQPRKKRNLIAESSAVGAAGLAAANPMLKRQQGLLNREKQFLDQRNYIEKEHKDWIDRSRNDEFFTKQKSRLGNRELPLLDREEIRSERIAKRLQPRLKQNARELALVKAGRKVSKYGAMGLAGVAGVELARRGINKIRRKGQ